MTYDIICIGSALLDVYLKSSGFSLVKKPQTDLELLGIEYGGKTEIESVEVTSGGGGTNNAVAMARKGFKTALIAEMGSDLVAATIKEELRREQVSLEFLIEEEHEETGISSILVNGDGGRAVAVYRGASRMLTHDDIPWEKLTTTWLYISSLGGDIELLAALIAKARKDGIKVAVNPGKPEIEKIANLTDKDFFNGVEVVIVNREEAALLTGENYEDEVIWKNGQGLSGVGIMVMTDGRDGGRVTSGGETLFYTAEKVTTIEETGAGDAFGSGLVSALMLHKPMEIAILWGKKQAASVVSYMGAKRGLLSLPELELVHGDV